MYTQTGDPYSYPVFPLIPEDYNQPFRTQSTYLPPSSGLEQTVKDQASALMSLTHLLEDKQQEIDRLKWELSSGNDSRAQDTPMSLASFDSIREFVRRIEILLEAGSVPIGEDLQALYKKLPRWARSYESLPLSPSQERNRTVCIPQFSLASEPELHAQVWETDIKIDKNDPIECTALPIENKEIHTNQGVRILRSSESFYIPAREEVIPGHGLTCVCSKCIGVWQMQAVKATRCHQGPA